MKPNFPALGGPRLGASPPSVSHKERPDGGWGDDLRPANPQRQIWGKTLGGKLDIRRGKSTRYRMKAPRNKAACSAWRNSTTKAMSSTAIVAVLNSPGW